MRKQTKQNTYIVLQPNIALLADLEVVPPFIQAVRDVLPHPEAETAPRRTVAASEIHA